MSDEAGPRFMRETSKRERETTPQRQGVAQPALELAVPQNSLIPLPNPSTLVMPEFDLRKAIEQRESVRKYAPAPISQEELSYLLWCTQGVKKVTDRPVTLRNVPSAGSRHAFETFLLIKIGRAHV